MEVLKLLLKEFMIYLYHMSLFMDGWEVKGKSQNY